jgi:hypothetical protein
LRFDDLKTKFYTLHIFGRKAYFDSDKKKEKRLLNLKNQLKIQTFSGSKTFRFKTEEKLLENINLQTKKLKFYSLICESFALTENEEKEI